MCRIDIRIWALYYMEVIQVYNVIYRNHMEWFRLLYTLKFQVFCELRWSREDLNFVLPQHSTVESNIQLSVNLHY